MNKAKIRGHPNPNPNPNLTLALLLQHMLVPRFEPPIFRAPSCNPNPNPDLTLTLTLLLQHMLVPRFEPPIFRAPSCNPNPNPNLTLTLTLLLQHMLSTRDLGGATKALTKVLRERQPVKVAKRKARGDTQAPGTTQRVGPDWRAFAQHSAKCKAVLEGRKTSRGKHGPGSIATFDTAAMEEQLPKLADPGATTKSASNNTKRRHYDQMRPEGVAIDDIPPNQQHRAPRPPGGVPQPIAISNNPRNLLILKKRSHELARTPTAPARGSGGPIVDIPLGQDFLNYFANIGGPQSDLPAGPSANNNGLSWLMD